MLAQQHVQYGGREIPVGHDRVDRAGEFIQLGHRGVEQSTDVDLAELDVVDGEQLVEPVILGFGHGVQRAQIPFVQGEHEDVLHTNGGFLTEIT